MGFFNTAIKRMRESRAIKQKEMASFLKCSVREIQYIESDRKKIEEGIISSFFSQLSQKKEISQGEWGILFEGIVADEFQRLATALKLKMNKMSTGLNDIEVILPNNYHLQVQLKIQKKPNSDISDIIQELVKLKDAERSEIAGMIQRIKSKDEG
jgi:hypothetical protein